MPQLTVRIIGGLGNQLHCYAFGKALAACQNTEVWFDCQSGYWADPYGRRFLLDLFPSLTIRKKILPNCIAGCWLYRLYFKLASSLSAKIPLSLKKVVSEPKQRSYRKDILMNRYILNPYFIGYWASYRYCLHIEDDLRQELQPPYPTDPVILALLDVIHESPSCFIHYRTYREEMGVVHPSLYNYYVKAIEIILKRIPKIQFFVFSDHIQTAKADLAEIRGTNVKFVDLEQSSNDVNSLNDFYLMFACDHAIVCDSTFSWWAAWLSEREGKIVIIPNGLSPWGSDWAPPHWIKVGSE